MTDKRTLYTSKNRSNEPFEDDLPLAPDKVMRQELKTYVPIDGGFKVITRIRKFYNATHEDSVTEEIILER